MPNSALSRTLTFTLVLALLGLAVASSTSANDFEVWLVDQSNSFGKAYGGTVYVYEGSDRVRPSSALEHRLVLP